MKNRELEVRGFSLIELLVVISLIGILATLIFANLNAARERGRDAERKADLRNIQTALRIYYNDKVRFPASNSSYQILGCGNGGTSACSWGASFSTTGTNAQTYMNVLPKDPLPSQSYRYIQTNSDTYTLTACLENTSDTQGVTDSTGWCSTSWVYTVQP